MRIAAAHAFERDAPARASEARDAEILARARGDPPARHRGGAFGRLLGLAGAAEDKGRHARRLGGELESLRRRRRIFAHFADDTGKTGMPQAFFHREEDIGVAARLDMDHAVGVQPREVKGRGEQVVPAQAPEDGALGSREDAGEEDRRARIVGQVGASGDLMERAGRDAAARKPRIDRLDAERNDLVPRAHALDPRNCGAKIGEDGRVVHDVIGLGRLLIRSLFVPSRLAESSGTLELASSRSAILSILNRVWLARVLIVGQIRRQK